MRLKSQPVGLLVGKEEQNEGWQPNPLFLDYFQPGSSFLNSEALL